MITIYKSVKKKYMIPIFIRIVIFGMLGAFFAFLDSSKWISLNLGFNIFLPLQLTCYGFLFLNFYLFLESLINLKPNLYRLSLIIGLLTTQLVGLWSVVWFNSSDLPNTRHLWLIADIGYLNLALFTCLFVGLWVYLKMFQYTREIKALAFALSMIIISIGYIIISMYDYIGFSGDIPEWLSSARDLGEVLPMTGIFIFVLGYLSDFDYVYRLPSDHYVVMIIEKSGVPLYVSRIKNKKDIQIEESLLSGFLSSLSMIFGNVLKSEKSIKEVSGEDAIIRMEEGEYVFAVILAKKSSLVLTRALRRFINEFESKYKLDLQINSGNISRYEKTDDILKMVFPFFQITKNKTSEAEKNV